MAVENRNSASAATLAPWASESSLFVHAAREKLAFDALVLAVVDPGDPSPDSFLIAHGVDAHTLVHWCETEHKNDPMFRESRRRGRALGKTVKSRPGPPLPSALHALVQTLPASLDGERCWYLALGRRNKPFDDASQRHASLLLRLVQVQFDHMAEPGMGRVLLGRDYRLLHADPSSEARFISDPATLRELAQELPPVIQQRWPELPRATTHDLALSLGGQNTWVRFRQGSLGDDLDAHYWYLELRPLGEDDLPAVGLVEDARIAAAMAYLTDHYAQAPSLADVARAVHTSPFHFHRLFSRQVGLSPKHFLLRMQLQMAKWMLRATRTSIGQIATATGFASHGHFTATFHRIVGVSPSTYREQQ